MLNALKQRSGRRPRPDFDHLERREPLTAGVSIGGSVFVDADADGRRGPAEVGLAGVPVSLYDAGGNPVARAATAADGSYRFDDAVVVGGLPAGDYIVIQATPPGAQAVGVEIVPGANAATPGITPDAAFVRAVVAAPGQFAGEVRFAVAPAALIAGAVFDDINGDGRRGPGEGPLGGQFVTLTGTDPDGQPVELTAVTAADGSYQFESLPPGNYRLDVVPGAGLIPTGATVGTAVAADGAARAEGAANGTTEVASITLGAGDAASGYLFGLTTNRIAGRVARDLTGDGLTPDDAPMAGVAVRLYRDRDGDGLLGAADGDPVAVVLSAADGSYRLDRPGLGDFLVAQVPPAGTVPTYPLTARATLVHLGADTPARSGVDFADFQVPPMGGVRDIAYTLTRPHGKPKVVGSLAGRVRPGDVVTATFTVVPGASAQLTLVSYAAPGPVVGAADAPLLQLSQVDTATFGPGVHSLTVAVPDGNFEVDFAAGAVIARFGPAGSNISYAAQGRLYSSATGGKSPEDAAVANGLDPIGDGPGPIDVLPPAAEDAPRRRGNGRR